MLRSAATFNCTEVQPSLEMKHITTRRPPRRRSPPDRPLAHLLPPKLSAKLTTTIRLFDV
jgi:hypothetical protein